MNHTANMNPRIIEGLYCEALVLSDEVRAAFDFSARLDFASAGEDAEAVALSCEALRTTTRMMHAVAWLLNHRAFFLGELSEFQIRRYGRLAPDFPPADADRLALLAPPLQALIVATQSFYARLLRLDRSWRQPVATNAPGAANAPASAIARLRERLAAGAT